MQMFVLFQVAKKASVLRRRKSKVKLDGHALSLSQTNVSGNQQPEQGSGEKDDTFYYIEENKSGRCRTNNATSTYHN